MEADRMQAAKPVRQAHSTKEIVMSRVSSALITTQVVTAEEKIANPKPVLVRLRQESPAERVTRRVAEVVDMQLANGSMPA
jgi:hypothetical protein